MEIFCVFKILNIDIIYVYYVSLGNKTNIYFKNLLDASLIYSIFHDILGSELIV